MSTDCGGIVGILSFVFRDAETYIGTLAFIIICGVALQIALSPFHRNKP